MEKKNYIFVGGFSLVFLFGMSASFVQLKSIRNDMTKLGNEISHAEEEIHEITTSMKRSVALEELKSPGMKDSQGVPSVQIPQIEYDFGRIPKSGGSVETGFTIRNVGTGMLLLGEITTSCACTSARVASSSVLPGDETIITVVFNPNTHEEPPDRFLRKIYIPTNDPIQPEIVFTIYVDIIENK